MPVRPVGGRHALPDDAPRTHFDGGVDEVLRAALAQLCGAAQALVLIGFPEARGLIDHHVRGRAAQLPAQPGRVQQVGHGDIVDRRRAVQPARVPHERGHVMTALPQQRKQCSPDHAGRTGDNHTQGHFDLAPG